MSLEVLPAKGLLRAKELPAWAPPWALVLLKGGVSVWALSLGFSHVSDDDFARVTLAQAFAHEPRLDPSGTSWLPFPFWLNGSVMMALGRSLAVARGVALASSIAGALLVYQALLAAGTRRWAAFLGVALAMSAPWSVWLGASTVPEALTACLMVFAALALAAEAGGRLRLYAGSAILAACLSRYEAWPVAAVFALACFAKGLRGAGPVRRRDLVAGALALAGPIAWMAWNAHAHGSATHFLARVAAYRTKVTRAPELETWTLYPEAFLRAGPLSMGLLVLGLPALFVDGELRRRWGWAFAAMGALALFLAVGDLRNGAPTHHPERALLALFWFAETFGIDSARSLVVRFVWGRPKREAWLVGLLTAGAVAWASVWPSRLRDYPARSASEDRSAQIAKGEDLRARDVLHLTVTPCAYEHFALLAAFQAPERATTLPSRGVPVTESCPAIDER